MAELEFERKETLSRQDAVKRLRAVADAIDGDDPQVELRVASDKIQFPAGDEVRFELEVELDDDELELELELKWKVGDEPANPSAS